MKDNPWSYKEDNKIKAQKQIKYMDEHFSKETTDSILETSIYTALWIEQIGQIIVVKELRSYSFQTQTLFKLFSTLERRQVMIMKK